jgi:flagellar motor switch/type III secretory pathway protein FliN
MADDEKLARLSMLASAPLEVVAEVGELILRADELIALQKGSVISLGRPRSTLVELRIADRVWARGELVDVDGELGVRVTELVAPEPSSIEATPAAPGPTDARDEPG